MDSMRRQRRGVYPAHLPTPTPTGPDRVRCSEESRARATAVWGGIRGGLVFASTVVVAAFIPRPAFAGPYAPPAGQAGSTAIANTDPRFVAWASSAISTDLVRGPQDIASPDGPYASFGTASEAVGFAQGAFDTVVSLGDGGQLTVGFSSGIRNGPGVDFAVFENSINDTFLELAYVEVSSDGTSFFRFDSASLTPATTTPTNTQVQSFGQVDATNVDGLAGKYRGGFGVPFDLASLEGRSGLDVNAVKFVRVVDVVGRIAPVETGTGDILWSPSLDSAMRVINDPYNTPFETGGFDLDGVGVINAVPEPTAAAWCAAVAFVLRRVRRRASVGRVG